MPHPLLRTVSRWRFERPLAVLLGAAATFATLAAAPAAPTPARWIAALALGAVLAGIAHAAMRFPWGRSRARPEAEPEEEPNSLDAAELSLRLRRADRHPDAPARDPIRASRELGSPFMDVAATAPVPDAEFVEVAAEPVPIAAEPEQAVAVVHVQPDEPVTAASEAPAIPDPEPVTDSTSADAPIAAWLPADEPAPHPARGGRESLEDMVARLSAGLERGGARRAMPSALRHAVARGHDRELRGALDELNRLAGRRH